MNISFELLSSMSPKVDRNIIRLPRFSTKLSLKKFPRRSVHHCGAKNNTIITIASSSSSSGSTESIHQVGNVIIISDSETETEDTFKTADSESQVDEENKGIIANSVDHDIIEEKDEEIISNSSKKVEESEEVILNSDDEEIISNSVSTNTNLEDIISKIVITSPGREIQKEIIPESRFTNKIDEMSKLLSKDKYSDVRKWVEAVNSEECFEKSVFSDLSTIAGEDSVVKSTNIAINSTQFDFDRKQQRFDEFFVKKPTKITIKDTPQDKNTDNIAVCENLLDSLYGSSWRANRDNILPSSEPRRKLTNPLPKVAQTERKKPIVTSKKKTTKSTPWKRIMQLSDSDSSVDNLNKPEVRHRLFDSSDSEEEKENTRKNTNVDPKIYSFLASLSDKIPPEKADSAAKIFRNGFQRYRDVLVTRLFKLYNEKIFDNAIPADTKIEWNVRMTSSAGFCFCKRITRRTGEIERTTRIALSTKILTSADRVRDTLVHEMCHAATWLVDKVSDGHGPQWQRWAALAMRTFPELPPIQRCHQYVTNTKYTYKCTSCGYSIGRHSKSLNVETKRCGYCLGKFEVFINKTTKSGETKSVPATPKRKPNSFALFVKENYHVYSSLQLKHGDIMKVLGSKFSEMKMDS